MTNVGVTGMESTNPDYEFGPFGRSFLGKFPTRGTLILFALSFLFALIISGGIFGFFFLFSLFNGLIFFLTFFHIEPHFNSKIDSNHKQQLRDFSLDVNSTISDIGRLFSGSGESAKTQVWDLSGKINFENFFQTQKFSESPNLSEWHPESKIRTWMKISIIWISLFFTMYIVALASLIVMLSAGIQSVDLFVQISVLIQFAMMSLILFMVIFLEDKFAYLRSIFNFKNISTPSYWGLIIMIMILDFIIIWIYTVVYGNLTSIPDDIGIFVEATSANDPLVLFLFFISLTIAAPLVEEMIFRGYVLDSLRSNYSDFYAILWSGILFGLLHWDPLFGFYDLYQTGAATIGGFVYGWLRIRTGSLWPSIFCHSLWNGTIFFFEFIV